MLLNFLLGTAVFVLVALLIGRALMKWAIGDKVIEPDTHQQAEMAAAAAEATGPTVVPSRGAPPPPLPFTLHLAGADWGHNAQWAFGSIFGALCLFGEPELLWTRWLAYPAGAGLLLIALVSAWSAWTDWRARLVVTASGLELHRGGSVEKRVYWMQVRRVSLVELWRSRLRSGSGSSYESYLATRMLEIADAHGTTLLELSEPLRPVARFHAFLDAVPTWAGVPVTRERRDDRDPSLPR